MSMVPYKSLYIPNYNKTQQKIEAATTADATSCLSFLCTLKPEPHGARCHTAVFNISTWALRQATKPDC